MIEAIRTFRKGATVDSQTSEQQFDALGKYAINLNEQARSGKLDPVIGRDEEIRRVLQILSRRTKNKMCIRDRFFAEYTDVDAVIALGCVIQGDTRHFDFICQGVTQGITQLQIQWNMPIAFGVLTVGDMQQALDRCGGRHGNKGDEAAATAINMVKLQIDMEAASPDHEPDRRNIN